MRSGWVALALAIFSGGCASAADQPSGPVSPTRPAAELFVTDARLAGATGSDAGILEVGFGICANLTDGDLIDVDRVTALSALDARALAEAAIEYLCPEHVGKL